MLSAPLAERQPYLSSTSITTIQTRYSNLINGPVSAVADPSQNIIRFTLYDGATTTVASPASVPSDYAVARERKSKAKIPRPLNAFIIYRQYQHPLIKTQYPGLVNYGILKPPYENTHYAPLIQRGTLVQAPVSPSASPATLPMTIAA